MNFQVEKNVFVIFYSGEGLKSKILKICEAFGANRYSVADDLGKQLRITTEVYNTCFFFFFFLPKYTILVVWISLPGLVNFEYLDIVVNKICHMN